MHCSCWFCLTIGGIFSALRNNTTDAENENNSMLASAMRGKLEAINDV